MKKYILTILFLIFVPSLSSAFTLPNHDFPKTANLYWRTPITDETAKKLAEWDIISLDMSAQQNSAKQIRLIRKLNPNIIILAYTTANEIPKERLDILEPSGKGLWHDLSNGLKSQWYLKTTDKKNISWWTGNVSLNLYAQDESGTTYADYLADFYQKKVLSTGLWDGLLFDNTWQNVSWVDPQIDLDNDGQQESEAYNNSLWRQGHLDLFKKLREKFGDKYLIIGNGDGLYHSYINGRMLESFPEYFEGGWAGSMKRYADNNSNGYQPRVNIINSDTDNTGKKADYRKMRYGLTSALLYNGYFSFDYGTQLREHLWWYDEYSYNLGQPKSSAFNLLDKNNNEIKEGIWQRDFVNGVVLVNSTDETRKIDFDSEYEKIHGTQDAKTNNGAIINTLNMPPEDGIILLRPIEKIEEAVFLNGSFARIFNGSGQNVRTGFFAYFQRFRGSTKIIYSDIDNDGKKEILAADKSKITIYDHHEDYIGSFYPYGESYQNGINFTLSDLNKDNKQEIITGTENGGSNLIKIFNYEGWPVGKSFYAFRQAWENLGVSVAAGDVNGDGEIEIIAGAGFRGGPHVKIFDKNGKMLKEFFAYSAKFRGGANVAAGDTNGDGIDEIITGAGFTGGPHVRVWNGNGKLLYEWFPYNPKNREGVKVAASDVDNDGLDEILTLTTNVFTTSYLK